MPGPAPLRGRPGRRVSVGPGRSVAGMPGGGNSTLHGWCRPMSCCLTAQLAFAGFMNRRLMTVAWVQTHGNVLNLLWDPSSNNHDCFLRHLIGIFPDLPPAL